MYTIGQVIYVVLNKKSQVYPMQVIEVITKKTLKGEEIRYLLQGGSDKSSSVMLDQVDGEVFETSDKARSVLTRRATQQINKIVDAAVQKAAEWYGDVPTVQTDDEVEQEPVDEPAEDLVQEVMLPDGTVAKAKVKMPKLDT